MRKGFAQPPKTSRSDAADTHAWEAESRYWRAQYLFQPYYRLGRSYEFYAPAYRVGFETAHAEPGATFDELVDEMRRRLEHADRDRELDWVTAEPAARAAWLRVERGRRRYV